MAIFYNLAFEFCKHFPDLIFCLLMLVLNVQVCDASKAIYVFFSWAKTTIILHFFIPFLLKNIHVCLAQMGYLHSIRYI